MINEFIKELIQYDQWIGWRIRDNTKIPFDPITRSLARVNDPRTWTSYDIASKTKGWSGLGFVLTKQDPFLCIDLDWHGHSVPDWAISFMESIDSYTEYSPSGEGVHIWIKASSSRSARVKKYPEGEIRFRSYGGFMTVTGNVKNPILINYFDKIWEVYDNLFPNNFPYIRSTSNYSGEIVPGRNKKLDLLLAGDWCSAGFSSQSEADLSLCTILFKITGDPVKVEQIFRSSGLYRPKWDEVRGGKTYGELTLMKACRN